MLGPKLLEGTDWPTSFARVLSFYEAWKPHVIQTEQVVFQELAIREMMDAGLPVTAIKPSTDKETRFAPIHLRYSMGQIWHAEGLDPEYEGELLSFPQSKHDDWVDGTTLALGALDRKLRAGWATSDNGGANWSGLPLTSRLGKMAWANSSSAAASLP